MTRRASRFFTLPAVFFLLLTTIASAEDKVALVIGNSAYAETTALPNTVNDATAVAASLTRLGFTVFAIYDATQADLLKTVGDFSKALKTADAAVLFYAGHGVQLGQENYILPVDIKVENELSVRYGAIALGDLLRDIESKVRVAIAIIDACRNNPYADQLAAADPTRALGATRGLARVGPSGNGAIVAYAAASGQVASDGDGPNSPFTAALIAEMEEPGVEIGLMFRRVAGRVIAETGGTQRPEVLIRLASEYYLAEPPAAVVTAAAPPAPFAIAAAPVDLQPAIPAIPVAANAPDVVARETARQAAFAAAQPDAVDRAALWGYMAALAESPFDAPRTQWVPPAREEVSEAEPNNTFGTAQPVNVNDVLTATIGQDRDTDFYRVQVQQQGTLTFRAPSSPENIDLIVRLLNANYEEVAYWVVAPRPGGELLVDFDLPKPGTYWLEVADSNSDAISAEPFTIELSYAVAADGFEPNDRIDLARHVPLDGAVPLTILPRGDQDWFEFTTDAPGSLFVSLTNVPEAIDGTFRLLNADGAEQVYWISAPRPGGDTVAVLDLPKPGVYYLDIADSNSDARSTEPLTLTTRFARSPDLYEPNDRMADAMPVFEESTHTMAIFPARDRDWLSLDIVQPGELTVSVESPPQNLNVSFRVLDGNGAELQYWQGAARAGGDLYGTFDAAKPGRYYLEFAEFQDAAGSVEPFTLDLGFTASLDAFEPNDTIGTASVLTAGGEVPFTIFPRGDADWYRVTVAEPGELAVTIDEGPENLDVTYRVVNPDQTELVYWTPAYRKGGVTEGFADLPAPGTYYVEVRDSSNDDRSIEPATLMTAFTPTAGSNEPNNRPGDATPVDLEGETMAHILPGNDGDYHVFYAPGPGLLDVTIDQVPENLDVNFRVLNADYTEIQYWIPPPRPGGDTTGTVTIPAAGWYWMELRDGSNDARSPEPFRVTRTFRPS